MAQYNDILLDDTENLQDDGTGDFKTGDASNQLMYYIVKSGQGNWKEFPLVGVGIEGYVNSDIGRYDLEQLIKGQLRTDVFLKATVNAENFPPEIIINKVAFEIL
jgi:hypothetical protein